MEDRSGVQFLLIPHSTGKEKILYNRNPYPYLLPLIGPRPPYYYNPRYEPYFPVI